MGLLYRIIGDFFSYIGDIGDIGDTTMAALGPLAAVELGTNNKVLLQVS